MAVTESEAESGKATDFAERCEQHSGVIDAAVEPERYPPRVSISFNRDTIPEGIHDLMAQMNAHIEHAWVASEGLALVVTVPESWKDAGNRTVREHGNSLVLTLSREALDAAGIRDDKVDLHARRGEIHVKKHDGDAPNPR